MILCLSGQSFSATSEYNPTGVYGKEIKAWKNSWSDAFFKCLDAIPEAKNLVSKIQSGGLKDVGPGKPWCPKGDLKTEANAKLFLLGMFKALALPESTYNERAVNPNGATGAAVGLFQMGAHDAKAHGCKGPTGKNVAYREALRKGENNICCALKIASNVATLKIHKQAGNQSVLASGNKGLFGAFWEPARSFSAQKEPMRRKVNKMCSQLGSSAIAKTFSTEELSGAKLRENAPRTPANAQPQPAQPATYRSQMIDV